MSQIEADALQEKTKTFVDFFHKPNILRNIGKQRKMFLKN